MSQLPSILQIDGTEGVFWFNCPAQRTPSGAGGRSVPREDPACHALCILFCCLPFLTQAQQIERIDTPLPDAPTMGIPAAQDASGQNPAESLGTISGTVVDQNGNFVFSARVRLEREGHIEEREAVSDKEGHFTFAGVPAGPFRLTITRRDFCGPGSGGNPSSRGST